MKRKLESVKKQQNKYLKIQSDNWDDLIKYINEDNFNKIEESFKYKANADKINKALIYSVKKGKLAITKLLLQNGADINTKEDEKGFSILMLSLDNGYLEIAEYLIKQGADLTTKTKNHSNVFIFICSDGNKKLLDLFLAKTKNHNIDINYSNKHNKTGLIYASQNENLEIVKWLLHNKADVNKLDVDGDSALIIASNTNKDTKVIEALIAAKADINTVDRNGFSPLRIAIDNDNKLIVKLLTYNGAKINLQDNKGLTALISAVSNNNLQMTKFLISHGADINAKTNQGNSAILYAICQDNIAILNLLIDKGADLHIQNSKGFSLVEAAVKSINLKALKILVNKGADVNIKNNEQLTPLSVVVLQENYELTKYLLLNGAKIDLITDAWILQNKNYRDERIKNLLYADKFCHAMLSQSLNKKTILDNFYKISNDEASIKFTLEKFDHYINKAKNVTEQLARCIFLTNRAQEIKLTELSPYYQNPLKYLNELNSYLKQDNVVIDYKRQKEAMQIMVKVIANKLNNVVIEELNHSIVKLFANNMVKELHSSAIKVIVDNMLYELDHSQENLDQLNTIGDNTDIN